MNSSWTHVIISIFLTGLFFVLLVELTSTGVGPSRTIESESFENSVSDLPPPPDPSLQFDRSPTFIATDISPDEVEEALPIFAEQESSELEPLQFPDNTLDVSDWKTYTNDEYGFNFKYPSDWEVYFREGECTTAGYGVALVRISPPIHRPQEALGTEICIDTDSFNFFDLLLSNGYEIKKDIVVNNIAGRVYDRRDENEQWSGIDLYEMYDGKTFYSFTDIGKEFTDVYEQILLSFKVNN